MFLKKFFFIALFLLFGVGTNLHLLSQETLPDTVWTKIMPEQVYQVKFAPDGKSIAVGVGDYIQIVSTESGNLIKELKGTQGTIGAIDYSKSGDTILFSGSGQNIILYDLKNDKLIKSFYNKINYFNAFLFNNSKEIIACTFSSITDSSTMSIIDISSGNVIKTNTVGNVIEGVAISPNSDHFVISRNKRKFDNNIYGSIELWDSKSLTKIAEIGKHDDKILDMAFSPDGTMLASAGKDQLVKLWDVNNSKLIDSIDFFSTAYFPYGVNFSIDNNYLAIAGSSLQNPLVIFDLQKKQYSYKYNGQRTLESVDVKEDKIICPESRWLILYNAKWNPTNINDIEYGIIVLYPNPATNLINIEFNLHDPENVTIELTDLSGNTLSNIFNGFLEYGKNTVPYNCSHLAQGIYFIKVSSPSFKATYKLIKEG